MAVPHVRALLSICVVLSFCFVPSPFAHAATDQKKNPKGDKGTKTNALASATEESTSTGPANCADNESCAGSAEVARPLQAAFVPDLFTGTMTAKIPLVVSVGRNGMQ